MMMTYDDAFTSAHWWSSRAKQYILCGFDNLAYLCAMYAATAGRIALEAYDHQS